MNWRTTVALVLAGTCLVAGSACRRSRPPQLYLFPPSASGWFVVVHGCVGAASLSTYEDNGYLLEFPSDGVLVTSTSLDAGKATDQFFRKRDGGGRDRVPLSQIRSHHSGFTRKEEGPALKYLVLFVGTEAELSVAHSQEVVLQEVYERIRQNTLCDATKR